MQGAPPPPPPPMRKSEHQRDADKRKEEGNEVILDDLGVTCLDELTKIDDGRRQVLASSEELKKRVMEAYQCPPEQIKERWCTACRGPCAAKLATGSVDVASVKAVHARPSLLCKRVRS